MKYTINDRYFIKSDVTCFTVVEVVPYADDSPKAGQTYERVLTYHGTLEQACQSVLNREIAVSSREIEYVSGLIYFIEDMKNEIKEAIREWEK